ncbi:peroxiredoxin type-2 [Orobanche minor]
MEVVQLQRNFLEYITRLFREGFLDGQFGQLQLLQDESSPDFVVEVVTLFFKDSERLLNDLTLALDQQNVDFKKIDAHVHQLKGSSSSIGAQRVKNSCVAFRNCFVEQNAEGVPAMLATSKARILSSQDEAGGTTTGLEKKILAAGGAIPMLNEFC